MSIYKCRTCGFIYYFEKEVISFNELDLCIVCVTNLCPVGAATHTGTRT